MTEKRDLRAASTLALLCICTSSQMANGASPESVEWHQDLRKARELAVAVERPILLYITADACVYCVKMKRGTLADPKVVDTIEKAYVPAIVNASIHPGWVRQLNVRAYPATLIITPQWKVVDVLNGYTSPQQLQRWLRDNSNKVTAEKKTDSVER